MALDTFLVVGNTESNVDGAPADGEARADGHCGDNGANAPTASPAPRPISPPWIVGCS